jgi:hypothetical protein
VRFAVNEPAPRPVARRGAGGVHRPPDGVVAGRVPLACDGPPEVHLGAFTERLLVEHVSARPSRRGRGRGLGRWLRAVRATARERRLPPGPGVRALTASGR